MASYVEEEYLRKYLWQSVEGYYCPQPGHQCAEPLLAQSLRYEINEHFGKNQTAFAEFMFCQAYLQARHLDSYSGIMQARYAFFRGLSLALSIATLLFAVKLILHRGHDDGLLPVPVHRRPGVIVVTLLVATGLSCWRFVQFEGYYADSVYRMFYVASKLLPPQHGGIPILE